VDAAFGVNAIIVSQQNQRALPYPHHTAFHGF